MQCYKELPCRSVFKQTLAYSEQVTRSFNYPDKLAPSQTTSVYALPYFPAHKTQRNYFVRNFRKKNMMYLF